MNISAPFIARPIATILLMIGLLLGGIVAYRLLPVAALPNVNYPTIQITAQLPGADPQTMASSVATPLEREFGRIAGVTEMTAQSTLGEMATAIDAAALLTLRAAWRRDVQKLPITREAAMAKMTATENAQWVIDQALQMFGGRGVRVGEIVERLYREIRALRIYEGATEVQKLIIGRELMKIPAK